MFTLAKSCLYEAAPEPTGSSLGRSALPQSGKPRALSIMTALEESCGWEQGVLRPLKDLGLVIEELGSVGV